MKSMKLGLQLGYWGTNPPQNLIETVKTDKSLGYDSVWTAEAYGSVVARYGALGRDYRIEGRCLKGAIRFGCGVGHRDNLLSLRPQKTLPQKREHLGLAALGGQALRGRRGSAGQLG